MLSKWSVPDWLSCSSRNREWLKRDGSSGNSRLLNKREEWRWGYGALNKRMNKRLNPLIVFEHQELSPEEKKKRMEMGIWSYEPKEDTRRTVVRPIVDIMSNKKSPKRQNNNTPRKVDQNKKSNKQEPLIDIDSQKQQQQIQQQQQQQEPKPQEAPGGLLQRQLISEVNKNSANVPPIEASISTVCEDAERGGAPPSDTVTNLSDRSTVDGSISPDRKSSGRPGSTRKLFTKVEATEHLVRNDANRQSGSNRSPSRSPNRPMSGRPAPVTGTRADSGRKSAPIK